MRPCDVLVVTSATIVAMVLLAASVIIPDWIERTTGFEPDNDSGRFEWGLSLAAVAVFVVALSSPACA